MYYTLRVCCLSMFRSGYGTLKPLLSRPVISVFIICFTGYFIYTICVEFYLHNLLCSFLTCALRTVFLLFCGLNFVI